MSASIQTASTGQSTAGSQKNTLGGKKGKAGVFANLFTALGQQGDKGKTAKPGGILKGSLKASTGTQGDAIATLTGLLSTKSKTAPTIAASRTETQTVNKTHKLTAAIGTEAAGKNKTLLNNKKNIENTQLLINPAAEAMLMQAPQPTAINKQDGELGDKGKTLLSAQQSGSDTKHPKSQSGNETKGKTLQNGIEKSGESLLAADQSKDGATPSKAKAPDTIPSAKSASLSIAGDPTDSSKSDHSLLQA
ncbi:MAG: hypothetical protein Q9M30_08920, partial [Mariprofundaceae bacterium]|nr:hypothetical protein [Mariprofundaceae bacterium]